MKLTANGTISTQTITVKMDPRVQGQATQADLVAMHDLLMKVYQSMFTAWDGYQEVRAMRAQLKTITGGQLPPQVAAAATEFDAKLAGIEGEPLPAGQGGAPAAGAGQGGRSAAPQIGFGALNIQFGGDGQTGYINAFGTADVAPTPAERRAYQISCTHLNSAIATWRAINNQDVGGFNTLLRQNNLSPLPVPSKALATTECGPPVGIAPPVAPRARIGQLAVSRAGFQLFKGAAQGPPPSIVWRDSPWRASLSERRLFARSHGPHFGGNWAGGRTLSNAPACTLPNAQC